MLQLMCGSKGIMVDNHRRPKGTAQEGGMVIAHNSHGYHASTVLYPTWLVFTHASSASTVATV